MFMYSPQHQYAASPTHGPADPSSNDSSSNASPWKKNVPMQKYRYEMSTDIKGNQKMIQKNRFASKQLITKQTNTALQKGIEILKK